MAGGARVESSEAVPSGPSSPPRLSPFVGPLLDDAERPLADAVRAWLDAPGAQVHPRRSASIATAAPTHLVVREGDARLALVLRVGSSHGWRAGPLDLTVEPHWEGRAPGADERSRAWLGRLASWFATTDPTEIARRGETLAELHHRWATLASVEDRFFRALEHSTNGWTAFLRPSMRCSQDCHFCWQGRDWPDPPDELVFTWLDELARSGARRLTLCGGEPTLFRPLPELIARASRVHGMRVHMDSNAIRLRDPAFARSLRDAGLASVLVSLHSADPAVSDVMTRARGTWARTVEGIHTALSCGLVVALNCVVERANVATLEDHARFVRAELVEKHPDNPVRVVNYSQPGKYYDAELFLERMVPIDEARPSLTAAARILDAAGVWLEITGTCGFPSCVVSEIPELVAWRPNDVRDATHVSGRSREPEPCRDCAARDRCVGVRHEYLDRFGARGLVPYRVAPTSTIADTERGDWSRDLGQTPLEPPPASVVAPEDARIRLPIAPHDR